MAPRPRPYTVFLPGPLVKLDDNLWTITDMVPGIPGKSFPRTMHIIRLADGRLLFHNAIPVPDDTLAEIAKLGQPTYLFVPSPFHCIDAQGFADKLKLKVLCPAGVRSEVESRVRIEGDERTLPADPTLRFEVIPGTRFGEGVLRVQSGPRLNLVVCDLFLNVPNLPGFWGWVWKLLGFTPGPVIGPAWLKRAIGDRAALRGYLEELAKDTSLSRIVVSHGPAIEAGFSSLFSMLAKSL